MDKIPKLPLPSSFEGFLQETKNALFVLKSFTSILLGFSPLHAYNFFKPLIEYYLP